MLRYRFLSVVALVSLFLVNVAPAQTTGVGIGLIAGEPTGISAKFWTSNQNALDFGMGWSNSGSWMRFGNGYAYYYDQSRFDFHADYLWHNFHAIRSKENFPLYYGLGFTLESGNTIPTAFGLRGVGGIEWIPRSVPLDIFFELAPVFYAAPSSELTFEAGIGARFFFR